jgi:FkbM family methyltransferase
MKRSELYHRWMRRVHKFLLLAGTSGLILPYLFILLFPPLRFPLFVFLGFPLILAAVYSTGKLFAGSIQPKSVTSIFIVFFTWFFSTIILCILILMIGARNGLSGLSDSFKDSAYGLYKINGTDLPLSEKRLLAKNYLGDRFIEILPLRPARTQKVLDFTVKTYTFKEFRSSFDEIFLDNTYSFETEAKKPVILDCGSNIGLSILYFKQRYPEARITAFEPDPTTFALLKDNVRSNRLKDVTLVEKALADSGGYLTFFVRADESLASSIYSDLGGHPVEVEKVRLSDYIDGPIDFLKMDVEGAEGLILDDLTESGKIDLIKRMIIEYHHHLFDETESLSDFLGQLENAGFDYQLSARPRLPFLRDTPEFIMIFAYRKEKS